MSKLFAHTRIAVVSAFALLALLPAGSEAAGVRVAAFHSAQTSACEAAQARPSEVGDRLLVRATLCVLNQERAARRLGPLKLNARLSEAAEIHSRAMVRNNFFSHNSLSGATFVDRIRRSGYFKGARSWAVAENLAWGSGNRSTPARIVRSWMQSPGHRGNILTGRYREIGIGVVEGAPVRTGLAAATYTTDFGQRG